ncbi:MAG: hypothetical protein GX096_00825 [Clostridiales bacterium]|nr:hypothetical protein [Clostridiales bacterium]
MKKYLSRILIVTCVLALCVGSALGEIKESEVEDRVYDLIEQHTEYRREQLQTLQYVWIKDGEYWAMSTLLVDRPENIDGVFNVNIDSDGDLVGKIGLPQETTVLVQISTEMIDCLREADGYLRLAEWNEKWSARSGEYSLDDMHPFNRGMIGLGFTKPAPGSIPYEEAFKQAHAYLAQQTGWDESITELFEIILSGYYTPKGIGIPVYNFFFDWIYSDESTETLRDYFGEPYPVSISVMVNALDGSLVEPPVIDFRPAQFSYTHFFVRTDEFLEAVRNNAL